MNNYSRGGFLKSLPIITRYVLIINVVLFLIGKLIFAAGNEFWAEKYILLSLFPFKSNFFNPYQFITYMFMHGGWAHLFFNMFAVFMFGRVIETYWGSKKFFVLYILAGIGAALLHMIILNFQHTSLESSINVFLSSPSPDVFWNIIREYPNYLDSGIRSFADNYIKNPDLAENIAQANYYLRDLYYHVTSTRLVGASGSVFGILIVFAMLFPDVELMLIFLPIPIKAKYFIPIYAVMELFLGIANFSFDNIAHFAHLGGAIVGFILVKIWKRNQFNMY